MSTDTLEYAIGLIEQNRLIEAQEILNRLISADPHNLLAWFWHLETCATDAQRINALENCLKYNPDSEQVKQALGRLKRLSNQLIYLKNQTENKPVLENQGYCPTCDSNVTFIANHPWLRDHYICTNCRSIPRERALMFEIETFFPNWRDLVIHESSPVNRGATARLSANCKHYIPSQFFADTPLDSVVNGTRCENLEEMSFENESIDLHITQDVMEHVFHPARAWKEIARTLKPNGAHIFTVPIVNKTAPSNLRARMGLDGKIVHILPPIYHGNPIDEKGSLMTVDWGYDICKHIFDSCGLFTYMVYLDDINKGIRAEYIEVLITFKTMPANAASKYGIPLSLE